MRLITKTDIRLYRQISKSVDDVKINPFIDDAQLLDLLPLIGEKFYFDIIANPANYTDLMEQKTYTYDGTQIQSPGLKRVLIDFTFARYVMHGTPTDTPFGMIEKQFQDGHQIPRTDKKEIYKQSQQIAMQYWGQVESYLNRNKALYPLWGGDCAIEQRKSFRLNHISR